jgi:hypothetical protein
MFFCSRWVDLFREQCRQGADGEWSKSLNMTHEVNYLVFDILGDLCFGKNFNMKEPDSDLKHIPELMAGFLQTLAPVSVSIARVGRAVDEGRNVQSSKKY